MKIFNLLSQQACLVNLLLLTPLLLTNDNTAVSFGITHRPINK